MANSYQEQIAKATDALQTLKKELELVDGQLAKFITTVNTFNGLKTPSAITDELNKRYATTQKFNEMLEKQTKTVAKATVVEEKLYALHKKEESAIQSRINLMAKQQNTLQGQTKEEIKLQQIRERGFDNAAKLDAKNKELARSYVQLVEKQKQAKKVLQDTIVSQGKNAKATRDAQREYDKYTAKVNMANKATSNFANTGLGNAVRGLRNLIGAFGIIGGFTLFANIIRDAFNLTKTLDSIGFAMRAVIKDNQELAQTQTWLQDITQQFGAELVTTTNRYIKFRAAAQQANFTAEETQKIFGTMTKAAGVLGLKTDELQGIYLALEQMISKGKITTEELRRQLGERLPGAMDIMADSMGVTTAQLDDMLKKGQVITKDVLPGFARQVEIAFGIQNVNRVDTLQAATIRLRNAWTNLVKDFNEGNVVSQSLMKVIDLLAKNLATIVGLAFKLAGAFLVYKTVTATAWVITQLFNKALWEERILLALVRLETIKATIATKGFTRALLTNPIVLAVAALTALYFALRDTGKSALDASKEINEANKQATESAKAMSDATKETKKLVDRYDELTKKAKELGGETKLSKDEQEELKTAIVNIGKAIPDAVTAVDSYSNALKLNRDEIGKAIGKQDELAASMARDNIREASKNLLKQQNILEKLASIENGRVEDGLFGYAELRKNEKGFYEVRRKNHLGFVRLYGEENTALLKQIADTKEQAKVSQELVYANEDIIASITGIENERQKELRLQREKEQADAKELKAIEDAKIAVEEYRKQIAELTVKKKELEEGGITTGEEEEYLQVIKDIQDVQSKIDAILGKSKTKEISFEKETVGWLRKKIKANEELIEFSKSREEIAKIREENKLYQKQLDYLLDLKEEKEKPVIRRNTADDFDDQIRRLEEERDAVADNARLYAFYTQLIKNVTEAKEKLTQATKDGTDADEEAAAAAKKFRDIYEEWYKAREKSKADFFGGFQDEFFSDAGFDKLNEIFLKVDENGESMFEKLWENADKTGEKFGVVFNSISEVAQEAFNFIKQNQSAQFDFEYERLEKQRDVALQFAGESAAAKERIEEQYEAKRKAIQRRQAKAQKELALFNTAVNTAQGIVSALAMFPPNPVLAGIIASIGAAQLALIASRKVPEFFRGTMNAPEGLAWVDEKGPEVHTDRQGRIKSTGESKANLRYLSAGDKIYKTKELYFQKELNTVLKNNDIFPYNEIMGNMPSLVVESKGLKASEMDTILGKHFARIQTNVTNIDKNGLRTYVKNQGGSTEKLNNRVTFKGYSV